METFVWLLLGSLVGWVSYSRFHFNEQRGRTVSMLIGAAGAVIGMKAIAPMVLALPESGELTASGLIFAAVAACAALAAGNLISDRWGV